MLAIGALHCILMKSTKRFLGKIFVEEEERRSEIALCGRACARKQSAVSVVKNRDILSHHQKDFTERFLVKRSSRRKKRSIWCKPNARKVRLAATKPGDLPPSEHLALFGSEKSTSGNQGTARCASPLFRRALCSYQRARFLIPTAAQGAVRGKYNVSCPVGRLRRR